MDLTHLGAIELAAMLAAKDVSAQELMQATLSKIDKVNGDLNAIVSLRERDDLLKAAQDADQKTKSGPLHGIPMAVKDLVETKDIRTTHGSPLFANHVPKSDDLLAARLKAAGAILIGKTNTPEFGLGSNTFNPVHGITPNPYDMSRSCGGSSGGAAVALAARMVALADGSDMMGSLRNPAAWNNVYGMRPSHGLVPDHPKGDMFLHPLATLGPMARSPKDLGLLLSVLAGPEPRSPHGREFASISGFDDHALKGKRIGWLGDWGGAFAFEPGLLECAENGLTVLQELGAHVDPLDPPHPSDEIWQAWIDLRSWAISAGLRDLWNDPKKRDRFKETAIWEIERGASFSAIDVHVASEKASAWYRKAAETFESFDALVLPTTQVWPFPKDTEYPKEIAGRQMDTYHRWMEVTIPIGLIGLPAVNLPVGFGEAGLPAGMQLFGPRGSDAQLLQMAHAYHQATDWPGARPPTLNT